jgi:hypothetical protein
MVGVKTLKRIRRATTNQALCPPTCAIRRPEDRVARREHDPAARVEREPDERAARHELFRFRGTIDREPVHAACPRQGIDDVQDAAGVECEPLRPSESGEEHFHEAVRRHPVDTVARTKGRRRHIQPAVWPEGQVERRNARRDRRKRHGTTVADAKDGAGPIADEKRPVGRKGNAAGDAEVGRDNRGAAVAIDAVHGAFEPARHVQPALGIERQGRGIRQVRHEWLAGTVGSHDENRDRPLLPARSAERHVQIAGAVEDGTVDLVKASRQRRADLDIGGLARRVLNAHRRVAAIEAGRHDGRQLGGGRRRQACRRPPDRHARQHRIDDEPGAGDRDASALHSPQRADRGDARRIGGCHLSKFTDCR